ncbi:dephospho-CoA kinase [Rhizobium sp. CECT 9324]|uniref:dephospho-CoA kinase n=1 Tax=Rhizobium sp. CECT 9324 TaxID=2845820 RepID=UPI001E558E38|nr:dephospho-CoA kinase [Rhizobium sp. CECT 9324]CAH0338777.1 Dephospho-CoA kinase [Rhizobium sp. CECT 9324]
MIVIGLTGSIGMGKSTTAKLFADEGIPVNDADQVVHDLYAGAAVAGVAAEFPEAVVAGVVDRQILARALAKNPANFRILEAIIHPLVRDRERQFVEMHRAKHTAIVLLDIPLLFEVGAQDRVDVIVVVTCDAAIQRQRVMARPGMTEEKFALILARQMPDAEKRHRADFIIDTSHGIDSARREVKTILQQLSQRRPEIH